MRHTSVLFRLGLSFALGCSVVAASRLAAQTKPVDRANFDTTCAPCQDFYTFANGGWLKRSTIPAAYTEWGAFYELQDKNEAVVRTIVESAAADVRAGKAAPASNRFKVGATFEACMDSTAVERLGTKPIQSALDRIAAIKTNADLPAALADVEKSDGLAPFGIGSTQDAKNSTRVIALAGAGGLTLPDRDYYLQNDSSRKAIRDAYVTHVARVFQLLGDAAADARAHAATVLALETGFARATLDRVTLRNPDATYHIMSLAAFDSMTPHVKWEAFIAKQHPGSHVSELNVMQPVFFKALDSMVTNVPAEDWKTLLRWRLVYAVGGTSPSGLPKAYADELFALRKMLTGQKEPLPRWKSCARATEARLGEAVGQEYVARTFSPAAKARAKGIVENMVAVLRERIGQLAWMGDSTKSQALIKLDAFTRKIGYPDKWKDYSALQVKRGEYVQNNRRANAWSSERAWAKIGKPVDRSEWGMTPPAVNAYYNPFWNEIVFPAGILQPPFYDPKADDAVNYGAMGAVIGHEMSHGFDDQGRRFDAKGNLRDWWTKDDSDKYNAQAQRVVDQFTAYTVVDSSTHVNGRLTLGENLGDLGGLTIAYVAMEKALAKNGRPGLIDGFTPEQRFFLGWAQVWRTLQRDESAKLQVATDPHSPAKWRVNGPLSNMPEFKAAWGCKDGDAMVRPEAQRARIW
jgi:putative endopeptidase